MQTTPKATLALDVGQARIGVALAGGVARLARPLLTLANDTGLTAELQKLLAEYDVGTIVVGLPRGLDGQETAQTNYVRQFAENLKELGLPLHFQDEALTSSKAEQELQDRGVSYTKEDVDALSATYILEDYLQGGSA